MQENPHRDMGTRRPGKGKSVFREHAISESSGVEAAVIACQKMQTRHQHYGGGEDSMLQLLPVSGYEPRRGGRMCMSCR